MGEGRGLGQHLEPLSVNQKFVTGLLHPLQPALNAHLFAAHAAHIDTHGSQSVAPLASKLRFAMSSEASRY